MKKPGEWIAALGADLEVSQVVVEASELLDLIEVTMVDRLSGRPTQVLFFDRVEGARLRNTLTRALHDLECAAIELSRLERALKPAADDPRAEIEGP